MGTRADFYVGRDPETMRWLGSIAWDGYDIPDEVAKATTEDAYVAAVEAFLKSREDGTLPEKGWPWPWETSWLTDCVYTFDDCRTWSKKAYHTREKVEWEKVKRYWWPLGAEDPAHDDGGYYDATVNPFANCVECRWPDMKSIMAVTLGARSGVLLFKG